MEPEPKMEARPPALIQWLVGILTPPPCREYVLGDLYERYRSSWLYALDALRTIPFVVGSQIRRKSSAPFLAIQALCVFACLMDDTPSKILDSVVATAAALGIIVLRDTYRGREPRWPRAAFTDAIVAGGSAFVSLTVFAAIVPFGLSPSQAFWDAFIPLFGLRMIWLPQSRNQPSYRKRIRYVAVLAGWTTLFGFAASVIAGGASGVLFALIAMNGGSPATNPLLIATVGRVWMVAPIIGCGLGLLLCIANRLPGTRFSNPNSDGTTAPSI
jgi:hypothetical protein